MSSRITVFPHPLTADREVLIVEPGTTLRKAIVTALPKIRIEYLSVYQNGKRVSDIDTPIADDAFFLARMEPQGIAGAIATFVMAALFMGTAAVGNAVVTGSFANKTKTSLTRPGLTGGGNSANPNGKVPWILGTHLITPYYGAAPYTSIGGTDGEQEYLHMLFVVGYGKLALSNFKLGTKLLATNLAAVMDGNVAIDGNFSDSNVSLEIQQSGSIPALYDASGWTIKETSVDSDLAGFRNSLSNADISGGELGGLTITVNATNKTIYRSAGNWGTAGVSIGDVITLSGMTNAGNNYPMIVTNVSGSTLTCWEATDMVAETHASISATVAPGNIVETAKRVRKISWTIEFPRGLVKWNVNSPTNYSVPVKAYYRQKGGSDGSWVAAPAWTGESGTTITRNKAITMRFTTITADLGTSYTGEYETRVVVEQPQANNDDTYTYFEDCTWASMRTHHGIAPVSSKAADKVVLIAMKIRASYQLQNTIDQFNVIATPVLTRAGAGTDEAYIRALPNTPAASFVHACMDSINPRPVAASKMDFATLRAWADSCAGIGLECNAVISSGSDMRTMLQQIASSGRASFYKKDMLYSVAADFAKATTVAHITPRNAWDFAYTRSFETLPHGFKVPFTNKDQDYESDERIVLGDGYIYDTEEDGVLRDAFGAEHTTSEEYRPGQNYVEATEFEELSLFGVTDKDQAWLMGRYEWESRKYRNTVYSVSMDIEQLVVTLGDKVRFSHPILSQALYSARISGLLYDGSGDVNGVRLDAPVTVAATYGCRIRTPSSSIYRAISNVAGETSSLSFSTVIAIASAPSVGDLVMVGPAGLETEELIVQGVQFNDDYSAQLTLVPYADEVFEPDDDTPPDFYSRIIKAGPTVVERALASDERSVTIVSPAEDTGNIVDAVVTQVPTTISSTAPKNLGRYNAAHPSSHNPGDYWTVYDTDDSPIQRGIWYDNAGTPTRISSVSGETGYTTNAVLLAKLATCMADVAWCENIAQHPGSNYGTASNYGIALFFESFGAVTAFIQNLFAQNITLSALGYLKSHDYAETGGYPTAGFMLDVANQVIKAYGAKFVNAEVAGKATFSELVMNNVTAGSNLVRSSDSVSGSQTTTPAKAKEMQFGAGGTLRISFDLSLLADNYGVGRIAYAQIYRNGVAVGTQRSASTNTPTTYTEDVSGFSGGDMVQIYGWLNGLSYNPFPRISNFRIYIAEQPGILTMLGNP